MLRRLGGILPLLLICPLIFVLPQRPFYVAYAQGTTAVVKLGSLAVGDEAMYLVIDSNEISESNYSWEVLGENESSYRVLLQGPSGQLVEAIQKDKGDSLVWLPYAHLQGSGPIKVDLGSMTNFRVNGTYDVYEVKYEWGDKLSWVSGFDARSGVLVASRLENKDTDSSDEFSLVVKLAVIRSNVKSVEGAQTLTQEKLTNGTYTVVKDSPSTADWWLQLSDGVKASTSVFGILVTIFSTFVLWIVYKALRTGRLREVTNSYGHCLASGQE